MSRLKNVARSFLQFGAILGLLEAPHASTKWQLQQYHQAEGAQTFSDACVDDYIAQGGTTNFVEEMLAIKDRNGNTVFENMPLCQYYLNGGTVAYANTLSQYVTQDGKQLFNHSNVLSFNDIHIPLAYIESLLQMQDQEGKRVIEKKDIEYYYRSSISIDSIRDLFSIHKKDETPFFTSSGGQAYLASQGTIFYAKEAAAIIDTNGNPRLKDDYELVWLYNQKVGLDDIREGMQIVRENGAPFFSTRGYFYFKKGGGTLEEALALISLRHRNGQAVFDNEKDINSFTSIKGTLSYAKEAAAIVDKKENPVFNGKNILVLFDARVSLDSAIKRKAKELHSLYDHSEPIFQESWLAAYLVTNGDVAYAQKLAALRNPDDSSIFTGKEIFYYSQVQGSISYAQTLAAIRDEKGYALFNGTDIRKALEWKLDPAYAQELAPLKKQQHSLDGLRIIRYWQLEMTSEDLFSFEDTEKPNALVIYPAEDNDEDPVFEIDSELQKFQGIWEHYDVFVRIAAQEQEVYDALLAMPVVDLFYSAGHGIPTILSLGEKDLAIEERTKDETYTLDTSDTELSYYLSILDPHAIIVESSCENAKEIPNEQNLAQFMEEMSTEYNTHRTIIAAQGRANANLDEIVSFVPFSIRFYEKDFDGIKDITYSSQ